MTLVATQVKRRRGTTAENDAFTGAEGEITVDLGNKELRVHTGDSKQGGYGTARKDFENITDEAKNISNWSSNVSNCITKIPQDIKLELNNGTLTLKAGSKVYVPNGVGNFDELVIQNDLTTITSWGEQVQLGLFVKSDGSTMFIINMKERCSSGSTPPTATNIQIWYDTTNNLVKRYASGADTGDRYSLPIALVRKGDAVESSNISSIDQVFNGFGYIGSTIFALPGVKGLIPNGRNADGTLKNTIVTSPSVVTMAMANYMAGRQHCPLNIFSNGSLGGMDINQNDWGTVSKLSDIKRVAYSCWYCEEDNFVHYFDVSVVESLTTRIFAGSFDVDSNNNITSLTTKTAFHAVDYSDTGFIAHQAMPDYSKAYNITLPASENLITAPNDGYFLIVLHVSSNGFLHVGDNFYHANSNGGYVGGLVPARKHQQLFFQYINLVGSIKQQFVPAVGAH